MIQRTISGSSNRTTADDREGPRVVNKTKVARFEILTATKLNIHVFWDVRQCTPAYSDVSKDHSTFIVRVKQSKLLSLKIRAQQPSEMSIDPKRPQSVATVLRRPYSHDLRNGQTA